MNNKFRVGDLVMCHKHDRYSLTDVGILCRVVEVISDLRIGVSIVKKGISASVYMVDSCNFKLHKRNVKFLKLEKLK